MARSWVVVGGAQLAILRSFFVVYIDDLCAISLVPWSRSRFSPSLGGRLAERRTRRNAAEGWPQSKHKAQQDAVDAKMGGVALEGNAGKVVISRECRLLTYEQL